MLLAVILGLGVGVSVGVARALGSCHQPLRGQQSCSRTTTLGFRRPARRRGPWAQDAPAARIDARSTRLITLRVKLAGDATPPVLSRNIGRSKKYPVRQARISTSTTSSLWNEPGSARRRSEPLWPPPHSYLTGWERHSFRSTGEAGAHEVLRPRMRPEEFGQRTLP